MPDVACPYTLVTPAGTITFNEGPLETYPDQYWIQEIQGLSGAPVRAPIDDMPYGHGALGYNFWEGGRHIVIDGVFLITSERWGDAQIAIRNSMEEDLRVALRSIAALATDTGTLTWTPTGALAPKVLTVRHDVQLECPHDQNYLVRNFHFGLFAADPDWDGWSS